MARNYNLLPNVKFNRSKFDLNHRNLTSMNVGTLYPISIEEVLPGDSFSTKVVCTARVTSSFIKPVMDNLFMDIYHFFVPLRLCYDKAEEVFGSSSPSSYIEDEFATIPTFEACNIAKGSVGDYLGIALGDIPSGLSVLPFRAFAKIYNEWFRNENITDEVYVHTGELLEYAPNANPWAPNNYTGMLPKVGKRKDYFTSALPKTQKGSPVSIGIGGIAPVVDNGNPFQLGNNGANNSILFQLNTSNGMPLNSTYPLFDISNPDYGGFYARYVSSTDSPAINNDGLYYKDGLAVDLSNANPITINDLRLAFQTQKMLEIDSLYGGRYREYLNSHFGVTSPDSRLQIPEYLGGGRIPLQVTQVAQTSKTDGSDALGSLGAFSLSIGKSHFSKGFVEHGYIISVACIRTLHSYQQGVPKMFSRTTRNDFYDPLFAHLGEQPIYKTEIFANINGATSLRDDNYLLGYNEAWAEYRSLPNTITGQMRSTSETDLDIWHFGDMYANAPSLTDTFILENTANIDRTVSIPSASIDNFICDFYFDTSAIRVMPTYSIPGLIDHR